MKLIQEKVKEIVSLNEEEMEALISIMQAEYFAGKDYITRQGSKAYKIGFINKGVLRAFFENEKGEQYNKSFFREGDFASAYSSLITGQPSPISLQCLTDCELLTAPYADLVALFDRYPKIERTARITAEQLFVQKEKREIELITLEAKERYKTFLQEYKGLDQRISQYHIASYLGITPTQLSRIRAQM